MKLTSKGRAAVTSLVDMSLNINNGNPVKLSDISNRQNISVNFLEQIFSSLKKKKIVKSIRGPLGGYMFEKDPQSISIYEVIRAIDEDFKINRCNGKGIGCYSKGYNSKCLTHNLWHELTNHISTFLHSISIEDVKFDRIDFKNKYLMDNLN
jgi:Rrf2 family iron-sulfur cluster assembly transcriptional regulator